MTIANGQKVDAGTDNVAFLSRKVDTDTVGKIDLLNVSSLSVFDVQKVINEILTQSYAEEVINNGAVIASNIIQRHQVRRIKSAGGAAVASLTPFGTGGLWRDGTIIELVGTDNSDVLTIQFSDAPYGAIVNGDIELEKYRTLVLRWDSVLIRWIEQTRNK